MPANTWHFQKSSNSSGPLKISDTEPQLSSTSPVHKLVNATSVPGPQWVNNAMTVLYIGWQRYVQSGSGVTATGLFCFKHLLLIQVASSVLRMLLCQSFTDTMSDPFPVLPVLADVSRGPMGTVMSKPKVTRTCLLGWSHTRVCTQSCLLVFQIAEGEAQSHFFSDGLLKLPVPWKIILMNKRGCLPVFMCNLFIQKSGSTYLTAHVSPVNKRKSSFFI